MVEKLQNDSIISTQLIKKLGDRSIVLSDSEKLFSYFAAQTTIVYFIIDSNGIFILLEGNQLSNFFLLPGQTVGVSIFDVYKDYPLIAQAVTSALKGEKVVVELVLKGSVFATQFNPIFENKVVIGVGGIANDITESKQAFNLEQLVNERTQQVEQMNAELTTINRAVTYSNAELNKLNELLINEVEKRKQTQEELEKVINDLKRTQSYLVESEKMASLGVLTTGIAHEINNPVNYISASIEGLNVTLRDIYQIVNAYNALDETTIKTKLPEIELLKKKLEFNEITTSIELLISNIKTGSNRIAEIIRSLSSFARVSENMPNVIDVHELINSTLVILQYQLKSSITVTKNYGVLPKITCYPGKIAQVFMNILTNSIHAIGNCGTITITTQNYSELRQISISIKDTGLGIDKLIIDKIFEPFFTTKVAGKGTGLGLSISYNIIKNHKGRIIVESEPNKGTEFIIYLPVNPNLASH